MTIPNVPGAHAKHDAGGMWIGRNFAIAMVISIIIVLGAIGYAITVVNARAADNQRETATVAKCSFQFTAYRAQYSQASNSSLHPVAGLPPYAGLVLPPVEAIRKHLAENCQKYLVPFTQAAKEHTP